MGLAEIQQEIKEILESVEGIGKVHDYERHTVDWKTFLSLFTDANHRVNGWTVSRSQVRENRHASMGVNLRTHVFHIRGYFGLKDSAQSEKTFQELVDKVCGVFREKETLNGTSLKSGPPQVGTVSRRRFSGILVHTCDITLEVREYVQYTPAGT
jgi:hypothetical protein